MPGIVVVGAQWGDEGKGKIVDILTEHAEVVVRYAGGPNAGHTLVVGNEKVIVRLVREADFAGMTWVKLQIGDNAEAELSDTDLENRAADRGLGIVRDTARDWRGRVVIQRENPPYRKTISVELAL